MTNELLWLTEYTLQLSRNLKNCNSKMSFNEISNVLIDSVVLPNKPLSNLEIIDAAKKLSLYGFRGVFLRDTLPKKKSKMNEYGILNFDSSSGDGTHWVMWFSKVRMSSISIIMECNLLVS